MIKIKLEERKHFLDVKKSFLKNNNATEKIENDLKKYSTFHNLIRIKNKTFVIGKFKNKFYVTTEIKFILMNQYKTIRSEYLLKVFLKPECKKCKMFSACNLNLYTKQKQEILKNILELNKQKNHCNINKKSLKYKPI